MLLQFASIFIESIILGGIATVLYIAITILIDKLFERK